MLVNNLQNTGSVVLERWPIIFGTGGYFKWSMHLQNPITFGTLSEGSWHWIQSKLAGLPIEIGA